MEGRREAFAALLQQFIGGGGTEGPDGLRPALAHLTSSRDRPRVSSSPQRGDLTAESRSPRLRVPPRLRVESHCATDSPLNGSASTHHRAGIWDAESRSVAPWPATCTGARGGAEDGSDLSAAPSKTLTSWMERDEVLKRGSRPGEPFSTARQFLRTSAWNHIARRTSLEPCRAECAERACPLYRAFAVDTAYTCRAPSKLPVKITHFLSGVIEPFGSTPPRPVT
jgi:hypothetical protein